MLPTGFFAVAVGIAFLVLIAVVSLRSAGRRRRKFGDGGPLTPLYDPDDDFDSGK
jgi:hypothetical protein